MKKPWYEDNTLCQVGNGCYTNHWKAERSLASTLPVHGQGTQATCYIIPQISNTLNAQNTSYLIHSTQGEHASKHPIFSEQLHFSLGGSLYCHGSLQLRLPAFSSLWMCCVYQVVSLSKHPCNILEVLVYTANSLCIPIRLLFVVVVVVVVVLPLQQIFCDQIL